jgi:serine/threonine-protein kinase
MHKPAVEAKPAAGATAIEKAELERVSHELAAFIGPIAEVVVKRAAKRSTSVTDLCGMVAQEIESSADRAKFLARCRR